MPSLNKILDAPKGLLAKVPTNLPIFNEIPAFSIEPKTFGTGSNLDQETTFNKNKTGGHFGDGFFYTHYAGQVSGWMSKMERNSPQGVQTFSNAELNILVDEYIVKEAPVNAKFIIVDFEPANPTADGWMWEYDDSNFKNTMNYIANRVFTIHNKYFYDWITLGVSFTYNRENYSLDGANNDGFSNSNSATDTNRAAKLLEIHRNPTSITRLESGIVNQVGIGYSAITYNAYFTKDGMLLPTQWRGVENMVLKHICNVSLKHKLEPDKKIVYYTWPMEDKPVGNPGRRSNIYTKFKPNSTTGAYPQNLTGKVKVNDNRLPYPSNIVEDTLLYTLSYPNVIHAEYWLHGSSYNPYSQIRYSSINGSPNSCMGGTFRTGNYQGSENSLACPSDLGDYIGTQAPLVSAFIKAPYRHAASDIKNILDGTQVKEFIPFQFKRHGETVFRNNTFENNTGGSCVAALNSEPYLEVWRNPTSGDRVIYFWDLFADAFAPTDFKIPINGVEYTGSTVGNRLYPAIILANGVPGSSTSTSTSTTTSSNVLPCNQGPTLLSTTNVSNTGLTFQFDGVNVFSIKWRIMSGSTVVRNGTISPTSSSVNITYSLLFAGVYTFEIEGNSCSSTVTSLPITIMASGTTSSTSSTSSTTTGGGGGGSSLGTRKMVWNFGGGLNNTAYNVAKQYGIQVISYNNFYWNMVERGLDNFNYDEIDYIIRKLKADGFKLILNLQPTAVRPGGNGFTLKDKVGDTFVENFYNGTSLAFLNDSHWDRDRFNNPVNLNSNLGNQVSFSYYNSFAMNRWEIFVARLTHYVVNHPFYNDVIEGFGILDGGLNETGFNSQQDPDIPKDQKGDAGYSDDEMIAYAAWLQTKYGTVANLNTKWGTNYNTSFTIGQVINRNSIPQPPTFNNGADIDYKFNNGTRDLMRFRLKKHRDFYIRTINIIKNPSSKISGLVSNTGIQVTCYVSENFTPGEGGKYGIFALKYMYDMFDIYFSSVTAGSSATNTNSFLGDVALRAALFRGTFGQKAFGQEQDGDPVDASKGQSKTAKLTFDLGYKYSIVALQTNASQWDRTVTSFDGQQRSYKDDVLLTRNTFCNGQTPLFPATAGSITYTDSEAFAFYNDPGGEQRTWPTPNVPGKKTQWKNETNIDSNTEGVMSSNILLINTATFVNEPA